MKSLAAFILGILLLVPVPGLASFANPTDPLTGSQSTVRILTLNVMQNSPGVDRAVRFAGIVNYLQTHQVHALALQELSGGLSIHPPTPLTAASTWPVCWMASMAITRNQRLVIIIAGVDFLVFKVGVMPRYPMAIPQRHPN